MGKQTMSTLDVAAEVAFLRNRVQGMWVINVYDISGKTYLLKLGTSGKDGEKVLLVLDSGTRFHTTKYDRGRKDFPSNFCLKLRKHIRDRRLNDVQQLGMDRIVDFTFGHGERACHLILELYAQGNIVLADSKYEVLTLLRSHRDDDKGYALMPRHLYPVHAVRLAQPITVEDLQECLDKANIGTSLKSVIASIIPYGVSTAEHCIRCAKLDPSDKKNEDLPLVDDAGVLGLLGAIQAIEQWLKDCWTSPPEGIIYYKGQQAEDSPILYEDFMPISLEQNKGRKNVSFDSFDAALDEYFSRIETQKADAVTNQAKKTAETRVEKTRREQEKRASGLHKAAETAENQAAAIEYNMEVVDAAIGAVNGLVASGMSWKEVENLIKEEAEKGNPIAGMIQSLQLDKNSITLLLEDPDYALEDNDDAGASSSNPNGKVKKFKVQVDLGLTAFGNVSAHYNTKKENIRKEQRTHEATNTALKASEKKAKAKMQQQQKDVKALHQIRKPHWFEKFNWFVSSENYLVISGRDALQNELVVKRYMGKDDLYIHADTHGASSTIIKNHLPGQPIPPLTLEQAGVACVCRSKAWEGKVVTSAWWVFAHQVSKSAPTGEYLTTGSFMVRGKKNFLPPSNLVYGFGFLFKLEDGCIESHKGERLPKNVQGINTEADAVDEQIISPPISSSHTPIQHDDDTQKAPGDGLSSASTLDSFLDAPADYLARGTSGDGCTLLGKTFSKPTEKDLPRDLPESSVTWKQEASTSQSVSVIPKNIPKSDRKKRMSKKERAAMKSGNDVNVVMQQSPKIISESTSDALEHSPPEEHDEARTMSCADSENPQKPTVPPPLLTRTRPKSGKNKKSKYDDWDDEDRELVMQFMGAGGEKKTKSEKRAQHKERLAAKRSKKASQIGRTNNPNGQEVNIDAVIAKIKGMPFTIEEEPNHAENLDLEESPLGHVEEQDGGEGCEDLVDQDGEYQRVIDQGLAGTLDSLTGCPKAEDTLLFALPVCAPYDVMLSYKYKVKLTPGNQKKGKAAKQAMELLTHIKEALPNEIVLMKGAPEPNLMHVLLGSVQINMPGMQKIREVNKKKKKGKK